MPPQPIQELRDLTRTRRQLTREIVQHTQRIQAVLEEANIKLSSVITDILRLSGRRILKAIVTGRDLGPDPHRRDRHRHEAISDGWSSPFLAGLTPRLDESAGKRRSTRLRKGAPWLKPVLVQAAWAASRKKNSYFEAQFLRLKARRGPKKAAVAVAASMLVTAYHMLADGTCYQDLGADHFARRNPGRTAAELANRARNLGFHVEIRPAA